MKRSKKVLIPRMRKSPFFGAKSLSVAVASVIATGCSFKEEAHIFKTVEECGESTKFSLVQCQAAYKRALADANKTAPRYRSLTDCEYDFGLNRCAQNNSDRFFMPLMAGFMISEAFRHNNYSSRGYNPLFSYYGGGYRSSRTPDWTTADGSKIAKGNRTTANVTKSAFKPKPKVTKTMSRGGFGSKVSAKSSWGGGSKSSWGG